MNKLLPLTGIRAIAALWVILFHLHQYLFDFGWLNPVVSKGYLGVDLFFILSGFILTHVHQSEFITVTPRQYARFLALRCARMLPVHYVILGILLLTVFAKMLIQKVSFGMASGTLGSGWDLILHLLNIQGWGLANHTSWNVPAWSISAEWFAYLLFPILAHQLGKLPGKGYYLLLIAVCLTGLCIFSVMSGLETLDWTYRYAIIRIAGEFTIGCALSNLFRLAPNPAFSPPILINTGCLILLAGFFTSLPDIVLVIWLSVILMGIAYERNWLSSFLSLKPVVFLGEISYSVYMIYALCALTLNSLIFHFGVMDICPTPIVFIIMLIALIAAGYLLYIFVEVPARKVIRNHLIERYLPLMPQTGTCNKRKPGFSSWQPFAPASNLLRIKEITPSRH